MLQECGVTKMPIISVIMTVYNTDKKYFSEAIDSILHQTYTDFEFLIIDDGSSFDYSDLTSITSDKRIIYFKLSKNVGIANARNFAIEKAKGEFIAFLDSDDVAFPERLAHQINFFENNPGIDCVGSSYLIIPEGRLCHNPEKHNDIVLHLLLTGCPFLHSSVMLRKKIIAENKVLYKANYVPAEDYAFWLDLIGLCNFANIDETLVKFLENIVYYALLTVVIIAALNKLGIATTSFLAILGAAGLAVGLALKDSLGNFASGVMIVLFKPFKVGDSVVAAGVSGTVTEVTIFNTVFLTADNQKIIVPNSSITSGSITNVNANNTRRVDIVVAISYEDSIKNAKDVLTNIINSNPKVLKDKGFGISVTDLAETSVKLGVNVWAKSSDYGSLKAELLEEIKIKFDEVGITIPYSKNVYQQIKN